MDRVIDPTIEALRESKDTDCISRQRLLEIKNKAIEDAYSVEDEDGGVVFCIMGADDLKEYLDNLFSSQELDREIQGDAESATTTDCISRKAATKAIEKAYCNPCKERGDDYNGVRCRACNFDDAISQIDALPPVEPKPVCEDAISKRKLMTDLQGILDACTPNNMTDFQDMLEDIYYKIKNASSVVPSRLRGEWINKDGWAHCSNCEKYATPHNNGCEIEPCHTPFCPWCGADMRGDKE